MEEEAHELSHEQTQESHEQTQDLLKISEALSRQRFSIRRGDL
jgi:hypothetical protein